MGLSGAQASAQVTKDASSVMTAAALSTAVTFNHVLGTGSNRLVVCGVAISNPTTAQAPQIPAISFGGVAMHAVAATQIGAGSTTKIEGEMW
jgi:hypothetical protein